MEDTYALESPSSEDNMRRIEFNNRRLEQLKKENEILAERRKSQAGQKETPALVVGSGQPSLVIPLDSSASARANSIVKKTNAGSLPAK